MSDKIQDKFAVLLAGFRTSEGAPRLVIPEVGADAAAMLKSKAGAAAVEARIDALGAERKALKRLGKFMRKHGAALDVAAPGVADGAAPARKARRPRVAAKAPAAAKAEPAAAATPDAKPAGRKPGRPRGSTAAKPAPSAAEPAAAAKAPARRPYTRKAVAAKAASANVAPAKAAAVADTPAPAAKPARTPRARKVAPAAAAAAPSAPTARRTGTAPGRRSGRKATPTT
jgi:hypothetical protein